MEKSIKKLFKKCVNVAILCHINADGDALSSSFALYEYLRLAGKNVVCYLEEIPNKKYNFLLADYKLISDYNNETYDLCIVLDCASIDRLGSRIKIFNNSLNTLNIDHHKTNNLYAKFNLVKSTYSAAAEVLAELFENINAKINDKTAMLLYAGIMSDSGCLKFSSTTSSTHIIVSKLLKYDFDHSEVTRLLFDSNSISITKLKGYLMNNIQSFENGLITLISNDSKLLKEYGVEENEADTLINIPRSIIGSQIAIEIKERSGKIRASLRSNGMAEVDRIAAVFGGGGHIRAAGVTLDVESLEKAKEVLLEESVKELRRIGL